MGNTPCLTHSARSGHADRVLRSFGGRLSRATALLSAALFAGVVLGWGTWAVSAQAAALPEFLVGPVVGVVCALGALLIYERLRREPGRADVSPVGPVQRRDWVMQLVRDHGLTMAEAGICAELCRGLPRAEVRNRLRITSGTLKCHLRKIYAKTIERQLDDASDDRDKLHRLTSFLRDRKDEWRESVSGAGKVERLVATERGWARPRAFPQRSR